MTTFTTQDREEAAKYIDVNFGGFNFRFFKESDEWVCRLPDSVMNMALEFETALRMDKE